MRIEPAGRELSDGRDAELLLDRRAMVSGCEY